MLKFGTVSMLAAVLFSASATASGNSDEIVCPYELTQAGEETGRAAARIDGRRLRVKVEGARPHLRYTVWIDHRNRATEKLADDYPLEQGALPRGVAPAFATRAPVYSGMRPDRNSFRTDGKGNALFRVKLDYRVLDRGASPVVGEGLNLQGLNRVGGQWLREYMWNPFLELTQQVVDERGVPVLPRSTAQGITIVAHESGLTHGMTPGTSVTDHVPAWKGDFPGHCR